MIWCPSVYHFKEKRDYNINISSSIQQIIQKQNEEAPTQKTPISIRKSKSISILIADLISLSVFLLIGLTLFCQVEGGPLAYKRQTRSPGRLSESESIIFFQDDDSLPYHRNNKKPDDSSSRTTSKFSASLDLNVNQNTELSFPPDIPPPMDVRGNLGGLSDRSSRINTNKDAISFVENENSPSPSQSKSDSSDVENDRDGHTSDRFGIGIELRRASIIDVPEYFMAGAGINCENGELVQFFERMICNSNSKRQSANYSYMRRNKPLTRTRRMDPLVSSSYR